MDVQATRVGIKFEAAPPHEEEKKKEQSCLARKEFMGCGGCGSEEYLFRGTRLCSVDLECLGALGVYSRVLGKHVEVEPFFFCRTSSLSLFFLHKLFWLMMRIMEFMIGRD